MTRAGAGRRWGLLGAVLAIPLLAGPAGAQQASVQAGGELAVKTVRQIEALLAEKAQRTLAQRKVSSQLLPARQDQQYSVALRQAPVEVAADETVMVDILADVTPEVLARIRSLGGTVINSVPKYRGIRARLPLADVEPLAGLDAVQSIHPAAQAVTRKDDTSEGDVAHRANSARTIHSVDGTGIGIGVLSNGVDTLSARQSSGDLPDRVTVLPRKEGEGSEGTAMLEIVHDLAPGADLYFATASGGGEPLLASNLEALCEAGADVIVDDVYFLREAAFQDGIVAQAVNAAVADGCVVISAGGNGGNKNDGSSGVWEGDYAAGSSLSVNGVSVGVLHDFGGGVVKNRITQDSPFGYVLQWADPQGASTNDYDLFLVDADDNVLASSTDIQNGRQDPVELIFSIADNHADARLLIVKTAGAADRYLRLDANAGRLATSTAGNLFGHSAAANVITVAAVDVRAARGAGGVFNGTESVRRSNSDGPRRIFFEADGTAITPGNFSSTGGRVLQKPDLAAATCVSTSTPGFSRFCGSSAAAPHAAAIAALMLEAAGGPDNVTLTNLRTAMTGSALDIEATGVDQDSGAGIVMAPGAVDAVDVPVADRNGAPTVVDGMLPNRTLIGGAGAVTADVANSFSDRDDDVLTYTALSNDPDRVAVTRTGSQLRLTPRWPGPAMVAVRATDPSGLSVVASFSVMVSAGNRDYDLDDDNFIDVGNLAQLDAMRYDLNGDGVLDDASVWRSYYAAGAFAQGAIDMGCPGGCIGYELTENLNFDTDGSGGPDSGDDYWNGGEGWAPIGGAGVQAVQRRYLLADPFSAIFEGNGRTIGSLFIDTDTVVFAGLFGYATSEIRNVGLIDADVTGTPLAAGLAGYNVGEIRASYVTGRVSGVENVGGLVGINVFGGGIRGSYATASVSGDDDVGGLAGDNRGEITAAYATGRVSGDSDVGGLVGNNQSTGEIRAAYATGPVSGDSGVGGLVGTSGGGQVIAGYWDTSTSGRTQSAGGTGRTTAQLQAPTDDTGIYADWDDDLWDIGEADEYPVLVVDFDGNNSATWQEFGYQLREGPALTTTANETRVNLNWEAVAASHWIPPPGVAYTLYRDDGTAVEALAENTGSRTYADTDFIAGVTYAYQVAAVVAGGEATRNGWLSVRVLDTTAPRLSLVSITSDPGTDGIYAAGDRIVVTAAFDEAVTVTGTPRVKLEVGGEERTADYADGSGTGALVFEYKVAEGESDDDGVSIAADGIDLNRGTIADASDNAAVLTHPAVSPRSGHRVDGVRPVLEDTGGAVVNGSILTLNYDELLDGGSTPPESAFTVRGGDRTRTVSDVGISGRAVILTVDPAVEHGEEGIRVSYRAGSGARLIRDVPGNEAAGLSNEPVTNETPDTTAPTVDSVEISSDPGTDRTYAAGEEIRVTVTFSETVEVTGTPRLTIELGSGRRTANYQGGSGTAALVFGYEVADGDSDTDGLAVEADSLSGGTIEDTSDNPAELDHDGLAADSNHNVDGVKPRLAASGGAVVNGTKLTLTYDEPLDGSSMPVPGDFTVSGGDRVRTVTGVRVNGSAVELTLDVGAEHLEAGIQVSYTPGDNPIRDVPGNDAEALSREPVTNDTPDTTAPTVRSLAITSNPGSDQTYAAGDEIEVTVTFDETVEVEGTPQLRLRVGTRTRTAGYETGTGAAALVFAYEVADGDDDTDGVSIEAGRIDRNGGTITDDAENRADLAHEAVAPQAGHKVDGVRPVLVSTAVDSSSLTLTYREALDEGSRPAPGDFTVHVDGSGRTVSGVSVSDTVVTLTLNPAVVHGDTGIRVSYAPDTDPIRDAVGNDAIALSNRSVTNTTGAPNTAPQITSPSSFDVPENQTVARRLAARDTDPGDEVTGWAIVGGTDRGQFTITSDTGDLNFRTAPDFEAPGDNEYEVTVEVKSGAGARELEAEQTITLRVTDEREPPGVPEPPVFSGETADILTVNWSEPDNTGPPITDYDVQYREKGTGRFIDGQHEGPGLSLTLDDLEPGTVYEVQVRATNDEGTSDWSESGEGMTVTPLTVQMTSDIEPPMEGPFTVRFSFSEPVTGFSSSDIESGQNPACSDDQNNPVFCDPGIGRLDTVDNRVFTNTVTPGTNGVAHNYTLTLTVSREAVRSSAGNKPNEEGALEVRVAPPGVTLPISAIGRTPSPGNGQVTLRWNTPANTGGAPIVRYEYRWAESGGEFSGWMRVGPAQRSATVPNLTNGTEYVFELRGVNALGYGGVETMRATPPPVVIRPPPPPPPPPTTGGGGGGGGGGRDRPPSYPGTIRAAGGDGAVTLRWEAPASRGSSRIQHYEYRIDGEGEWISTGSTDRAHTIAGLINGRVYVFHLRAVSAAGAGSHRISPEATPVADLDFTHFANGGFVTSTLALVNAGAYPVRPAIYFYDQDGDPIAVRRVVELTPDLEVADDGALRPRTVMNPLEELTIASHGRGGQRVGSVTVRAPSSIGGVLRFDIPNLGVAGVADSPTLRDALLPVRRQEMGINTGVAVRNRGTATLTLQCGLMRDGAVIEEADIRLAVNGQDSRFIDQVFPAADTSDFAGSVRCTAPEPGLFSAVAFELDGIHRIFTTLPVVPVPTPAVPQQEQEEEQEQEQQQDATRLDFTHFANGGKIVSSLVLVNAGANPVRPAIYFYDQQGDPIAAQSLVDLTEELEIGDDGALSPGTAMNPLGELTISSHGRGVLKVGSVAVTAEGPIGGVLRFDIPALGVAGVGDSPPVRDALVPVRRQDGGINTGVAVHNRDATALLVRCRLMRDGVVLEETMIPLAANGQDSRFIDQVFPTADTSDFVGSVRCLTPEPGLFSAVAFELDGIHRIFTTLPVVPVVEVP